VLTIVPDKPDPDGALEHTLKRAESELAQADSSPFSPSAFSVLKEKVAEYIRELVNESVRVSRRHQADTVSAAHVERGAEYLVSITSRRFFRHLGTVGGILLGASLSNILAMTTAGQYSPTGILVSAGLAVAGAFMIALHIGKD
jgi:hypothetical protein